MTAAVIGCVRGAWQALTDQFGVDAPSYEWCETQWRQHLAKRAPADDRDLPVWLVEQLTARWRPPSVLTLGSLCSGIGGLELGLERTLGSRTVWQAEVDPHASAVLATRWPEAPNLGDLTTVDWAQVEPVDVMCFGFPCQDISSAGRRAGLEGDKSGLWFACADAVRLVRPRWVLVENVAALLVRGFGTVLGDLAEMGYVGCWGCLRSSDIGAPHRRERVFIAAADARGAGTGRDDRRVPRPAAGTRRPRADVRPAGDGGATAPHTDGTTRPAWDAEPADRGTPHVRGGTPGPGRRRGPPANTDDRGRQEPIHHRAGARRGDALPGRDAAPDPHSGGRRPHLADDAERQPDAPWGAYTAAVRQWERIHGPAPAPRDHRGRLNPALPEWMLGYPAGWVTDPGLGLPRTAQLRVLGNSVQPQVAELAARLLLEPLIAEAAA